LPELPKVVISKLMEGQVRGDGSHPDPDLLTAFVERTLPDRERTALLGHLADCSPCREIVALAQPAEAEAPVVSGVVRSRQRGWFLRWGVLAACAAIAVSAVLLRTSSQREARLVAKQEAAPPIASAPAAEAPAKAAAAVPAVPHREEAYDQPMLGLRKEAPTSASREDAENGGFKAFARHRAVPSVHGPSPMSNNSAFGMNNTVAGNNMISADQAKATRDLPLNGRSFGQLVELAPGVAKGHGGGTAEKAAKPAEPTTGSTVAAVPQASAGVATADALLDKPLKAKENQDSHTEQSENADAFGYIVGASAGAASMAKARPSAPPPPPAQQAEIKGKVVDPSGAVIPDAEVTVTNAATGAKIASSTNASGAYDVPLLPAGSYTVAVSKPGFQEFVQRGVNVGPSTVALNATLQMGTASEMVEVTSASTVVDTSSSTVPFAPSDKGDFRASSAAMTVGGLVAARAAASWQVTDAGTLQRSFDGGKSWESVSVSLSPPARLRAVASTGFQVWVGGSGGALFHSDDAGAHFSLVKVHRKHVELSGDIVTLAFADERHGRVETASHEVWTTADGGKTWRRT